MAFREMLQVCKTLKSLIFLQRHLQRFHSVYPTQRFVSLSGSGLNLKGDSLGLCHADRRAFSTTTVNKDTNDGVQDELSGTEDSMDQDMIDSHMDITDTPPDEMGFDSATLESLLQQQDPSSDVPLTDMKSPYQKPRRRCMLCKYDIELDYKNVQLLSQFTSPYTGRIYGRHITGLCIPMQKRVSKLIQRARNAGFMPFTLKETTYLADPKLFDPFRPGSNKKYF